MTIFPAATLNLPGYRSNSARLTRPVTPREQPVCDGGTTRYGQDVLYLYEQEHL